MLLTCSVLFNHPIQTVKKIDRSVAECVIKLKTLTNTLNMAATLNGSILGALLSCGKTGNGTL